MSGLGVDCHETEMSGEQNVIIEASVVPLFFADLLFSRDLSSLNHLQILYREMSIAAVKSPKLKYAIVCHVLSIGDVYFQYKTEEKTH